MRFEREHGSADEQLQVELKVEPIVAAAAAAAAAAADEQAAAAAQVTFFHLSFIVSHALRTANCACIAQNST